MRNWYKPLESRFRNFPKDIQILNVVSDLIKAKNREPKNRNDFRNHLYMALILLDYMADDPKWKEDLRELRRLREAVASLLGDSPYGTFKNIIDAALSLDVNAYTKLKS